jgi:dTDP-4-dehydrorhamnose reductase
MRVLVFGGSGWVGRALVDALIRAGHDVVAPRGAACDVADARAVKRAFDESKPDAVVNAAAAQGTSDAASLVAVNFDGAGHVALAAARTGARLVHVSTDLVLDGRSPPYRDDAPANPVTAYGRSKAAGEAAVLAACPRAVVVRASHVYDPSTPDAFLASCVEQLRVGAPCRLFVDEIRCPIARPALASALTELVGPTPGDSPRRGAPASKTDKGDSPRVRAGGFAGTLNVAGADALSRFDYGTLLLEHFRVPNRERVEKARAADLVEPRPRDLTLDASTARALLATPLRGVRETLAAGGADC